MKKILVVVLFLLVGVSNVYGHGSHVKEEKGIQAANTWLNLVDRGAYGLSWERAAKVFTSAVTREHWEQTAGNVRAPLGGVGHRQLNFHKLTNTMEGMPDGLYLTLRYLTKFEKKKHAVESVILMKESDGVFRVIGYFIK